MWATPFWTNFWSRETLWVVWGGNRGAPTFSATFQFLSNLADGMMEELRSLVMGGGIFACTPFFAPFLCLELGHDRPRSAIENGAADTSAEREGMLSGLTDLVISEEGGMELGRRAIFG